jgi:tripartite-type tricarboxylate transporter receptor subunit TctC
MRSAFAIAAALLGLSVASDVVAAQGYPTKPVTLVVPFPPGGGNDALARTVADKMSRPLGQQVVVENRGGAGGTIATRAVSKAAPDGYTILLSYTGTFAINPSLYPNVGYDPRKDFTPIGLIASMPSVLVVHPSLPVRSTTELIAYGRANPGKITYAFVPGTVGHITTELFAKTAGIELTKIPYKGNGDALANLIGGHVSTMFLSISPIIGNVKAGTLHALALTTSERSPLMPDVPPIAESGVPGFAAAIRYGLVAPPGTPRPIIERLNKELRAALADEQLRAKLAAEGASPLPGTPDEYGAAIDADELKWAPIVKSLNLKFE